MTHLTLKHLAVLSVCRYEQSGKHQVLNATRTMLNEDISEDRVTLKVIDDLVDVGYVIRDSHFHYYLSDAGSKVFKGSSDLMVKIVYNG